LRNIFRTLSINCILDVGANHGQYGETLRAIGYTGWILSFEPASTSFDALSQRAARDQCWRAFRFALGPSAGQAEIHVTDGDDFSSLLMPLRESQRRFPRNRVVRTETVEVRRLDEVFEECTAGIPSPRVYLKLDTQGFDLQVLQGAERILPNVLALQTEVSFRPIYEGMPSYAEALGTFSGQGFRVVDFMPVTRDVDRLCAIEMDCVMARSANW
jgi:FkbM family methyltransferase